ncbi:chemotaxis-related protein WspB [Planctomicrobium piriforme]|uniref:Chemotaxis-related protein WspB n=2 Tax=Planctomicrobium piriforme TaxID=1576369 RepID=A0A1I3HS04_9PLAN|nr:chemotaxis-related protein WspB [Planctomicrobium piriforme]
MCNADGRRYALRAGDVVELTPRVYLAPLVDGPPWLCGMLNYRGRPVPVVDLGLLASGQACPDRYSARIVLMPVPDHPQELFGLLVDRVSTANIDETQARRTPTGLSSGLLYDEEGLIHLIEPDRLLPVAHREMLFAPLAQSPPDSAFSPEQFS